MPVGDTADNLLNRCRLYSSRGPHPAHLSCNISSINRVRRHASSCLRRPVRD